MIDLRALFLDNPELRRNVQIELNPRRLFTAGVITAVFALIVLPSLLTVNPRATARDIPPYLLIILWSQKITLTLGGAIFCWRSVRRERELNTFDFQRITRLSPLELAVGKLFGAPALAYFVTLCLALPAFFSAATSSSFAMALLVRSYVLLFTGSLVIHAFALMISTVSDKSGAIGGVVLLLLLQIFPAIGWLAAISAMRSPQGLSDAAVFRFYGLAFSPTILWAILELGFAAWFLLAVVRNIKLDVEAMQLFTVGQGLGFAAYCNFVWIGFYPWNAAGGGTGPGLLLFWGLSFFYLVGIGVLQSRELLRRKLREGGTASASAGQLLLPIGLLLGGAVLTALLIVALAEQHHVQDAVRGISQDFFLVPYFVAWLARDLFFLQWMKIRPVRSPLRKAFLYLAVFYVSTSIVFRSSFTSALADSAAFSSWFAPFALLRAWKDVEWNAASGLWLLALLVQLGSAAAFAYLYLQQVAALATVPKPAPPAVPPASLLHPGLKSLASSLLNQNPLCAKMCLWRTHEVRPSVCGLNPKQNSVWRS